MDYNYNKKSIWKWILLYVLIGAVAYGLVYYFYFSKNGQYGGNYQYPISNSQTQNQNNSQNNPLTPDQALQKVTEIINDKKLIYPLNVSIDKLCIIDIDTYSYAKPVTGEKIYQVREKRSVKCDGDPADPLLFLAQVNLNTGEVKDYAYSDYYFKNYK